MSSDVALQRALLAPPAPVYLITGTATVLVDRATEAVVAKLLPLVAPASFNASTFVGGDGSLDQAIGLARTPAMMADRRLVVVRDLHTASDAFFEALAAYAESPVAETSLVLSGEGFPKVQKGGKNWSARLGKKLAAAGVTLSYAAEDVDVVAFAVDHAAALGHPLSRQDASLLVELVGRDLGRVANEVGKATLYVEPGATLDAGAIGAACSALAEKEVWDLTTAIAGRDADAALGALHRLLAQGDAAHRLHALVVWQMRTVLRIGELIRRGGGDFDIARDTRSRPDLVRRVRATLGRDGTGAAARLERLARAHRAMNRVKAGEVRVLEALVVEMAT